MESLICLKTTFLNMLIEANFSLADLDLKIGVIILKISQLLQIYNMYGMTRLLM